MDRRRGSYELAPVEAEDTPASHRRGDLIVLAGFVIVAVLFVVWGVWLWWHSGVQAS